MGIDAPETVCEMRVMTEVASLRPTRDAIPAGIASVEIGSKWLARKTASLALDRRTSQI